MLKVRRNDITTVRPSWERTMTAKLWNKGTEMSCILITGPKRDAGTVFMKNGEDIWNFVSNKKTHSATRRIGSKLDGHGYFKRRTH